MSNDACTHEFVSVMFADVVGFTHMCEKVSPACVKKFLHAIFTELDLLCDTHNVHKLETAGDCYVACTGGTFDNILEEVMTHDNKIELEHHIEQATRIIDFGISTMKLVRFVRMPHDGSPTLVRVGIHSGSCVSGTAGVKLPKLALFGDTINTASRMASTAPPGRMQISSETMKLIHETTAGNNHHWELQEHVYVKGKGDMRTYLWKERPAEDECPSRANK